MKRYWRIGADGVQRFITQNGKRVRTPDTDLTATPPYKTSTLFHSYDNLLQEEVCNVILGAGITLDESGTIDTQLRDAIVRLQDSAPIYTDTGSTANAYVITPSPAYPANPPTGTLLRVLIRNGGTSRSGASLTLTVNGTTSPIVNSVGATQRYGQLTQNTLYTFIWNGTSWVIVSSDFPLLQFFLFTMTRQLYVNAATGNNNNDGLTSGTAFATIEAAWNYAKANPFRRVQINVAAGTYSQAFDMNGDDSGVQALSIVGASASTVNITGSLVIEKIPFVEVREVSLQGTGGTAALTVRNAVKARVEDVSTAGTTVLAVALFDGVLNATVSGASIFGANRAGYACQNGTNMIITVPTAFSVSGAAISSDASCSVKVLTVGLTTVTQGSNTGSTFVCGAQCQLELFGVAGFVVNGGERGLSVQQNGQVFVQGSFTAALASHTSRQFGIFSVFDGSILIQGDVVVNHGAAAATDSIAVLAAGHSSISIGGNVTVTNGVIGISSNVNSSVFIADNGSSITCRDINQARGLSITDGSSVSMPVTTFTKSGATSTGDVGAEFAFGSTLMERGTITFTDWTADDNLPLTGSAILTA